MTILFALRAFARNLLRESRQRNIFSYFRFNIWSEVWTVAFTSNKTKHLPTRLRRFHFFESHMSFKKLCIKIIINIKILKLIFRKIFVIITVIYFIFNCPGKYIFNLYSNRLLWLPVSSMSGTTVNKYGIN